jgi:hypothetical protein
MPKLPQKRGFFLCTLRVPHITPFEVKSGREDQIPLGGGKLQRGVASTEVVSAFWGGVV